ncbi:MAG: PQQ-dependent sugar dehydrogenase [Kofleriaceae bacterium]|nr:PQQ-dependent sugar dehydrogenase [Kofleriaceae bacterium]
MKDALLPAALFAAVFAVGCDKSSAKQDAGPKDALGDSAPVPDGACQPLPALPTCANPVTGTNVVLRRIGTTEVFPGDQAPLLVTAPTNDPRLFVVIREGTIQILENEVLRPEPFLDLESTIVAGGERGLLGLAFHPQYSCNGQFFVYYTTNDANVIARCSVSATDPNKANPTCTPILSVPDFASNHNGGMLQFGADGYLYIGTGDGGGGGDPRRNGQRLTNDLQNGRAALLGKMLRIDVDRQENGKQYGIPADNPYAGGGGEPEVWMYGLRNPWRWSFDQQTGDMWIGDVGQIYVEELTVMRAGEQAGKNLGWSIWEGNECCDTLNDGSPNGCEQSNPQQTCDANLPDLVFPQDTRRHPTWISIIAGTTYRGSCYPDFVGWHFYTDHNSSAAGLHRARLQTNGSLEIVNYPANAPQLPGSITSMHHDARGEIWVTTLGGSMYHLEAAP